MTRRLAARSACRSSTATCRRFGTVFDVLRVDGGLSGKFTGAGGLSSFPSGDRYFKVVESADQRRLSLEVAGAPGGLSFALPSRAISDAFGTFLDDDLTGTTQADFNGSTATRWWRRRNATDVCRAGRTSSPAVARSHQSPAQSRLLPWQPDDALRSARAAPFARACGHHAGRPPIEPAGRSSAARSCRREPRGRRPGERARGDHRCPPPSGRGRRRPRPRPRPAPRARVPGLAP